MNKLLLILLLANTGMAYDDFLTDLLEESNESFDLATYFATPDHNLFNDKSAALDEIATEECSNKSLSEVPDHKAPSKPEVAIAILEASLRQAEEIPSFLANTDSACDDFLTTLIKESNEHFELLTSVGRSDSNLFNDKPKTLDKIGTERCDHQSLAGITDHKQTLKHISAVPILEADPRSPANTSSFSAAELPTKRKMLENPTHPIALPTSSQPLIKRLKEQAPVLAAAPLAQPCFNAQDPTDLLKEINKDFYPKRVLERAQAVGMTVTSELENIVQCIGRNFQKPVAVKSKEALYLVQALKDFFKQKPDLYKLLKNSVKEELKPCKPMRMDKTEQFYFDVLALCLIEYYNGGTIYDYLNQYIIFSPKEAMLQEVLIRLGRRANTLQAKLNAKKLYRYPILGTFPE
ncbi:hypothetical protein [Candidatus Odyssella thessalonicensis]|uniref:hypothetical protein n=1 Tax=Candidatus Odyssella thessalonicensis TaxID=84647 RepID=UPI000225BD9D|nr:hypothetical protein [Candidatus Odyssella thessalonicensis]